MKIRITKVKSFQAGGQRQPIVLSDINDYNRRNRAYQDSLTTYNNLPILNNNVRNYPKGLAYNDESNRGSKEAAALGINPSLLSNGDKNVSLYRTTDGHSIYPFRATKPVQPYQYYADDNGDHMPDRRGESYRNDSPRAIAEQNALLQEAHRQYMRAIPGQNQLVRQLRDSRTGQLTNTEFLEGYEKIPQPIGVNRMEYDTLQPNLNKLPVNNIPLPLPKPDWFSRPRQQQEANNTTFPDRQQPIVDYFDKQGKPIKQFGGNVVTWQIEDSPKMKQVGGIQDPRQDPYYTPSSSDKWEIEDEQKQAAIDRATKGTESNYNS